MCDYCLRRDIEAVSKVQLRQPNGKWTEKVYSICERCRKYLLGVYKNA